MSSSSATPSTPPLVGQAAAEPRRGFPRSLIRPDSGQSLLSRFLLPVLSLVVFLGLWQVIGASVDPILLATPTKVIEAFGKMISSGTLGPAFATAMKDLALGYVLAIVAGVAIGVVMGRSRTAERIFNPYINFFQATPLIALVPLVVIWFGVGLKARVAVTFMLAVWSIIINTATGVKETPAALIDVGRIYKLNRRQTITSIALPNAVPSIFAGLRIGLGKALIGMVIAQMEISVTGLGGLVINYGNAFKTAYLLAAIFTASMVGVIAGAALELLRRWLFPWTKDDRITGW